ncbi:MAG: methyltransferase domain-containing protein [Chloroflexota bacterium]|nr:methyltransferase domain-containing protein [Chloroflexota bacterium]
MMQSQLTRYMDQVRGTFNVDELLRQRVDDRLIVGYYKQSDYGYRKYHSPEGAVHMALNLNGEDDKDAYYGQARIVQRHIDELRPARVLELASGKGFNTLYLAKRNPEIQFTGIDLTPTYVATAQAEARGLPNLSFRVGDFHHLDLEPGAYGVAFAVESLCHATDLPRALSEAREVLSPGGRLIVIDAFRGNGFADLDPEMQTAARLVEASMAVEGARTLGDWLNVACNLGFEVRGVEDLSQAIRPNLLKHQQIAQRFFNRSRPRRMFYRFMKPLLTRNAIAGLLVPLTVEAGAHVYSSVVLGKP